MSSDNTGWKCFYNDNTESEPTARTNTKSDNNNNPVDPTPSSKPTAIFRVEDGKRFSVGDNILIESDDKDRPYIGRIQSFTVDEEGVLEMLSLWYSRSEDIPSKLRRADCKKV